MTRLDCSLERRVAGGRLASSAQPPRATLNPAHRPSLPHAPQPFRSISFLDKPGALLEGLRCLPAFRPLPKALRERRKGHRVFSPARNQA